MDRVIKNYEEPIVKPMSLKESLNSIKHKRAMKKIEKLQKKAGFSQDCGHDHSSEQSQGNTPPEGIAIVSLAIVVDDIVVDIINTAESFSDILQKNPKFIVLNKKEDRPEPGWAYKDNKFVPFHKIISEASPTRRG